MYFYEVHCFYYNAWSYQGFEIRSMTVELVFYVKTNIVFYKLYNFLCRRYSLINRFCYNNLFQIMQHDNIQNLSRVIVTQWKCIESQVNTFWFCFEVIKWYTFYSLLKEVPILGSQISLLHLSDAWLYQILMILFFNSVGSSV